VTAPEDNILGSAAGVYIAVHDGYYALLPTLKAGWHTIHWQSHATDGFVLDLTYHVDVVEPAPIAP